MSQQPDCQQLNEILSKINLDIKDLLDISQRRLKELWMPLSGQEIDTLKAWRRKLKNRKSAKEVRTKKEEQIKALTEQVQELEREMKQEYVKQGSIRDHYEQLGDTEMKEDCFDEFAKEALWHLKEVSNQQQRIIDFLQSFDGCQKAIDLIEECTMAMSSLTIVSSMIETYGQEHDKEEIPLDLSLKMFRREQ